jgi:dephospho-CoA kinase
VTRSSDEVVHELLRADPEVHAALREHWGEEIVGPEGADRKAIAAIVFADRDELAWLESLLHPKVVREWETWRDGQDARVSVTEVPLLYETGGDRRFDAVVVVTASPEVRKARLNVNDARERRLIPDEEKVRRADYAYVNDGTLEELDAFVADVMAQLEAR